MCDIHTTETAVMLAIRENFRQIVWIYEGHADQETIIDNPLQFVLDGGYFNLSDECFDSQCNLEYYRKFSETLYKSLIDVHIYVYNPGTDRQYYAVIDTYDTDTELDGNAHAGSEVAIMYIPTGECFIDTHSLAAHIEHDDPNTYKRIIYELFMSGGFIPMRCLTRDDLIKHFDITEKDMEASL